MVCLNKVYLMKFLKPCLLILSFSAVLSSCYYDNKEELYQNFPDTDCDTSNTRFTATIHPIIIDNCAIPGCHFSVTAQSGLDFTTYDDVQTVGLDGRLVGRITGSSGPIMPPSGALPPCEIEQIKKWVRNGSQNN